MCVVVKLLLYVILFLIALIPRGASIEGGDPQGDELFWNSRVTTFLAALHDRRFSEATSHLGHPSIPAVVAMAIAREVNEALPIEFRVDSLTADRIGNATLSALVAPLSFALLAPLLGFTWALLVAILIAFDPQHIAVSRIAHVDSSFSLFVISSSALYLISKVYNRPLLTIAAGVTWGLAMACKPVAICLPISFFTYNCYRKFYSRDERVEVVSWGDIWAMLAGLGTLAAVFTRFWHHHGPFLTELKVDTLYADVVYSVALSLRDYLPFIAGSLSALIIIAVRLRSRAVAHVVGLIGVALTIAASVPQVLENYVRYVWRLFALADHVHRDIGTMHPWIPGGYLGLLLFQLPTLVVISGLFGIAALARDKIKGHQPKHSQAIAFFGLVGVAWLLTLSVSTRSYTRYVVPILPVVYIPVAFGVMQMVSLASPRHLRHPLAILGALLIGGSTVIHTHPSYLNYFNDIFGGVATAARREYPLFNEGHTEALRFIYGQPLEAGRPTTVAVIGELPTVVRANDRIADTDRASMKLSMLQFAQSADYIITTEPLLPVTEKLYGQTLAGATPIFTYERAGVSFAAVYRSTANSFQQPQIFPLHGTKRRTGGVSSDDRFLDFGEERMLYAMPERHREGLLFTQAYLRLEAGEYVFGLSAAVLQPHMLDASKALIDVRLGDKCSRVIRGEELDTSFRLIPFSCVLSEPALLEVSGYWHGHHAVAVQHLQVARVDGLLED